MQFPENTKLNTEIFRLAANDIDEPPFNVLRYAMVRNSENQLGYGLFSLDPVSGVITLIGSLDREGRQSYTLQFSVTDSVSTVETNLTVQVQDVNDNTPIFKPLVYSGSVVEDAVNDTAITTVTATDKDVSGNGISYSITSGNTDDLFAVDSSTGEVTLAISGRLDYETRKEYTLIITAEDNAGVVNATTLNTTAQVIIAVTDANDNAPIFTKSVYTGTILEHGQGTVSLLAVRATDKDSGTNKDITYSIVNGTGADNFTINSNTGVILSPPGLDYEEAASLYLIVQATDGGNPELSSTATVSITITDINDNSPIFEDAPYTATVLENSTVLTPVYTVSASDADSGNNQIITFGIFAGNEDGHFSIVSSVGTVQVADKLSFLGQSSYVLTISATDGGQPGRVTHTTLTITIQDTNNHLPQFNASSYSASISELSAADSFVLTVSASDRDNGAAGIVRYSLINTTNFDIDTVNGTITVAANASFDYDGVPPERAYQFTVQAVDLGYSPTPVTAVVEVFLTDENDNYPIIETDPQPYLKTLREDDPIGTPVVSILAQDKDSGSLGSVTYSITAGNEANRFAINTANGDVTLARSLDFETTKNYVLTVTASDGGSPPLTDSIDINITVVRCKTYHRTVGLFCTWCFVDSIIMLMVMLD